MHRAVVVILDGLRRDFVDAVRIPRLAGFAAQAETFPGFRTAFPSTTRAVSASFATGCHPARHSLQGNAVALLENGALVPHDVGRPDFLAYKRGVTGQALAVPTLAELVATHGGAILFNNVSPGAANAHDPDAHGHLYHRVVSRGLGGAPVTDPLRVTLDAAGDRVMTKRFIAEALPRRPALAVLWLGEPDHIQRESALGSLEQLGVLRDADRNAGTVIDAVARQRADGNDVPLIIGSDHGHETVSGSVDVEAELLAADLKDAADSADVVALSNGTASLVYLHPDRKTAGPGWRIFCARGHGRGRRCRHGSWGRSVRRRIKGWPMRCHCGRTMHRTNSECPDVLWRRGDSVNAPAPKAHEVINSAEGKVTPYRAASRRGSA
jgi:hypothetical protein